jgi:hypothetical protein
MHWVLRVKACFWVIASAKRYLDYQKTAAPVLGVPIASDDQGAHIVHEAFWLSLALVLGSGVVGAVAGATAGDVFGPVTPGTISALQVAGALLLLWGTLFVRGWQIQTYKGKTLIERVNQWIYRSLYCLGTAMLVASLVWPQRQW